MKFYAQFYENNVLTGKIDESLGSDGVMVLDGRLSKMSMMVHATKTMQMRNKNLSCKFVGFKIIRSDRFVNNGNVYYSSF